jgi:hypothetical protein
MRIFYTQAGQFLSFSALELRKSCLCFLIFLPLFVSAQKNGDKLTAQSFNWDHQKIRLTTSGDYQLLVNSESDFELKSQNLEILLHLSDKNDHAEALSVVAENMKIEAQGAKEAFKNGYFKGFFMVGMKNGHQVLLVALTDMYQGIPFYMALVYAHGDGQAEEEAIRVLKTLESVN